MAKSSKAKGGGARQLNERVRTAKGRKLSSSRWLERQLNDPYVAAAKRDGLRSRAAYKLIEMDDAHGFLKPGARVVDLGAAPGSWSQIAAGRVKSAEGQGMVVALDILDMDAIPGVEFLKLDFEDDDAIGQIHSRLGKHADVVLSDMAPGATGHKRTDHLRIIGLTELALDFAKDVLVPGGTFLAKVWQGGSERELLQTMKRLFATVRHVKPEASRKDSSELYVLATGFRGEADD